MSKKEAQGAPKAKDEAAEAKAPAAKPVAKVYLVTEGTTKEVPAGTEGAFEIDWSRNNIDIANQVTGTSLGDVARLRPE